MIPEGGQRGEAISKQFTSADLHSVFFDHLLIIRLSLLLAFKNVTNKSSSAYRGGFSGVHFTSSLILT